MNKKDIAAKIERSSLGTPNARAARRTVTTQRSSRVVASAEARALLRAVKKRNGG